MNEARHYLQRLVDASKRIVAATATQKGVVEAEVQFDKALREAEDFLRQNAPSKKQEASK